MTVIKGLPVGNVHFETEKVLYTLNEQLSMQIFHQTQREILWLHWLVKNGRKLVVHLTGQE